MPYNDIGRGRIQLHPRYANTTRHDRITSHDISSMPDGEPGSKGQDGHPRHHVGSSDRFAHADARRAETDRLRAAVTASVTTTTPSETQVGVSNAHGTGCPPLMNGTSFSCRASITSLTPMKPRMTARPVER